MSVQSRFTLIRQISEKNKQNIRWKNCTNHGGTHKKPVANRKQSRGKSHAKVPLKSVKEKLGNAKRCKINGNLCHITSHLIIYVEIIKRNERCFDTTMNSQDGIFVKVLISSCLIVGLPDGTFTQTTSCLCQHAPVNRLIFSLFSCFHSYKNRTSITLEGCDCYFSKFFKCSKH